MTRVKEPKLTISQRIHLSYLRHDTRTIARYKTLAMWTSWGTCNDCHRITDFMPLGRAFTCRPCWAIRFSQGTAYPDGWLGPR